jgi:23S rRNA (pseudouridine1915-N3)-methyltransferase
MKFSDFEMDNWEENRNFFDTCLIPFTGLSGLESPPETVQALERLRDFMDLVEKPFKGRVVTYPAIQYAGEHYVGLINEVCQKVKSSGFQYAIVLTADIALLGSEIFESDLVLSLPIIEASQKGIINSFISRGIQEMWQR